MIRTKQIPLCRKQFKQHLADYVSTKSFPRLWISMHWQQLISRQKEGLSDLLERQACGYYNVRTAHTAVTMFFRRPKMSSGSALTLGASRCSSCPDLKIFCLTSVSCLSTCMSTWPYFQGSSCCVHGSGSSAKVWPACALLM